MDGDVNRSTARTTVGDRCGLQGNYDPAELIEENGKSPETVRETAKALIDELGPQRLIANLGEGLGGRESTELVKVFVDTIHEYSESKIRESK
jgi:Uroporphyrinogen-III decarboxylase